MPAHKGVNLSKHKGKENIHPAANQRTGTPNPALCRIRTLQSDQSKNNREKNGDKIEKLSWVTEGQGERRGCSG